MSSRRLHSPLVRLVPMAALGLFLISSKAASAAACEAVNLRTEQLESPMAVDTVRPRLSWQMADSRRGAKQTAYQVLVATRPELLKEGLADLWDSRKVDSPESAHVSYRGKPLASRARAVWSVRVWDKDGKPSGWSRPARWEMGLLDSNDWKAQWIGVEGTEEKPDDLTGVSWIWFPEGNPLQSAPEGERYFRTAFNIPAGKTVKTAVLLGAVDNSFTAYVNGKEAGGGEGWQSARSQNIADKLKAGRNVVAISARNASAGPAGFAGLVRVTFTDGTTIRIPTSPSWTSTSSKAAGWQEAGFAETGWKPSLVIAKIGTAPWGVPASGSGVGGPAPLLRKTFSLTKPILSARLYATARGSYRLRLNGKRVGNDILTPDWTDYRKRILYQVYDVTPLLQQGENAVGAMVGDGWYSSGLGWGLQRNCFGPPPNTFLMQMHVQYTDGTEEIVTTDGSWRAGQGPIDRSEIYAGETYDARKEQPGWDTATFSDSGWRNVDVVRPVGSTFGVGGTTAEERMLAPAVLSGQNSPTIQMTEYLKPKKITNPTPGVYVVDMGQNMVGWARLRVKGPAGTAVKLRFAEILKADGNIYRDNLRMAEATDTYRLRGGGTEEIFEPHFTFHGFRYIEVTGFPGKPGVGSLTGCVFHTNARQTGRLATSDPMVNQLISNINWGLRGNLTSIPTDCPQRDERLGWMGDAEIFWSTACFLRDMGSFTHKFGHDMVEAQSKDGAYSDVSPRIIDLSDGAPAWGDAGIIVPYAAYKQYGDTQLVRENWEPMKKWIEYIHSANPDYLWMKRRNNDFGDWVPANSETDKGVIATAYWAYDAQLMAQMARAIGRTDEATEYDEMFRRIRDAFNARFVKADGTVGNGSQTCYVLALHMNLLPEAKRPPAMQHLVADIEKRDWHLSTGFIGTPYLMLVLTQNGRSDVAYRLLLNDTYPSWGYTIKKGATTIWERWNGDTGDPSMNSFNHYSFGAVGEWLFRYVGGINADPSAPGFRRMLIRPIPNEKMTSAKAECLSQYGPVRTEWSKRPGEPFRLTVSVPANTTALVYVPTADSNGVQEGGRAAASAQGVKFQRMEGGAAVYEVGAGTYRFTAP